MNKILKAKFIFKKLKFKFNINPKILIEYNNKCSIYNNIQNGELIGFYDDTSNLIEIYLPLSYNYNQNKYRDDYYTGRGRKLNKILGNTYIKNLKFVILHELGHAYFFKKYREYNKMSDWKYNKKTKERYADNFALRYLKEV